MTIQVCSEFFNARRRLPRRFERKFYLPPMKVGTAYGLLRQSAPPDSSYPSEQINSLYFDTIDLDQHERSLSGDTRKDKVRIRWYGDEKNMEGMQTIFIELKSKVAFESTKQRYRMEVPAEALSLNGLRAGIIPHRLLSETLAGFGYFPSRTLHPVIKISYWRHRFCDIMTGQSVSLDSHIRSTMIMPGLGCGEKDLELPGATIEMKGRSMKLPVTLMQMKMLDTDWSRFSKYSACIDSHTEDPGSIGRLSPSGRIINQLA